MFNVQTAAAVVWDWKWCWKLAIAYREGGRCPLQFLLPSCLADSGRRSRRSREVRRISPSASSPRLVLASCWLAAAARCSRPRTCSWRRCCSLCHRIPHLLAITLVPITSKAFIKIQYCIYEKSEVQMSGIYSFKKTLWMCQFLIPKHQWNWELLDFQYFYILDAILITIFLVKNGQYYR